MADGYIKQHIVPQVYLCRFAEIKKKYHKIGVRHEHAGQIRLSISSVKNVGFRNNIYDDKRVTDTKHWEHELSSLYEPLYGARLSEIISKVILRQDDHILSSEDKEILSKLIIVQFVRVPPFLSSLMKSGEVEARNLAKNLRKVMGADLTAPKRRILDMFCQSRVGLKSLVLHTSFSKERIETFSRRLSESAVCVVYNRTQMPFFTSDNPVIFYNMSKQSFELGEGGIARSDTVVLYPITPLMLILIMPRAMLLDDFDRVDGRRFIVGEENYPFILQVNSIQVRNSINEVYFPPSFMRFVKDLPQQ